MSKAATTKTPIDINTSWIARFLPTLSPDAANSFVAVNKLENLKAATALHFAHYNLCRIHKTLRVTPAMAAGIVASIWEIEALLP